MANDNCSTAQTFCQNCQTVGEYSSIKFQFSETFAPKTKATTKWKTEVINGLTKISNYGSQGTKSPTDTELNTLHTILSKQKINDTDYNEIITILKNGTKVQEKTRILGSYFLDLQDYINNYKLNVNLCNTCNSGCNTTCQASAQCNDYCSSCDVTCDTNCESNIYSPGCGSCGCEIGCQGTCNTGVKI